MSMLNSTFIVLEQLSGLFILYSGYLATEVVQGLSQIEMVAFFDLIILAILAGLSAGNTLAKNIANV